MVAMAGSSLGSALIWGNNRQLFYNLMRGDFQQHDVGSGIGNALQGTGTLSVVGMGPFPSHSSQVPTLCREPAPPNASDDESSDSSGSETEGDCEE